jgi:hypothetical protein
MITQIQKKVRNGALIALSAAALIQSGMALSADSTEAKVHCAGVNSCKGTSACKSAENACKGQNVCKGHGWLPLSAKECTDKGGTVAK